MRLIALLSAFLIALAACAPTTPPAPEGTSKFVYKTADREKKVTYLCENGPSAQETKARSVKAHQFLEKRQAATVDRIVARMEKDPKAGGKKLSAMIEREVEATVREMEKRYRCVMIGFDDI